MAKKGQHEGLRTPQSWEISPRGLHGTLQHTNTGCPGQASPPKLSCEDHMVARGGQLEEGDHAAGHRHVKDLTRDTTAKDITDPST